jgi:hypothetical protein
MVKKYLELECDLLDVLPEGQISEVNQVITELTKEYIRAGDNVNVDDYTHSVCHLFEKYGMRVDPFSPYKGSYLNIAEEQLSVAGELVDYTLMKALREGSLACVGRIVRPIMDLNLAHLEDNSGVFFFKPQMLADENFISHLSESKDSEGEPYLIDFCESERIAEFFPKYVDAIRKTQEEGPVLNLNDVLPGVFIDVANTLIEYDHYEEDLFPFKKLASTQEYALRKMNEGIPVTVFTGGDVENAVELLEDAGIDKRLCNVKPKEDFIGKTLETCVDDTAPAMQGFRAMTHYTSGKMAWDAEYSEE